MAIKKHASGGGGGSLYTYIGTAVANSENTVNFPTGWAVGDLLIGYATGGSGVPQTTPTGWTVVSAGTNGCFVCYKVAASGDSAFSAGSTTGYYAVSVFRRTSGTPTLDVNNLIEYTTTGLGTAPTLASSTSGELLFVVFGSSYTHLGSPDPATTSGIDTMLYNTNGFGGCGLVGNYTLTTTSGSFGGQTCTLPAIIGYPAMALSMLFK